MWWFLLIPPLHIHRPDQARSLQQPRRERGRNRFGGAAQQEEPKPRGAGEPHHTSSHRQATARTQGRMLRWVKPGPIKDVPTLKNHTTTLVGDKVRESARVGWSSFDIFSVVVVGFVHAFTCPPPTLTAHHPPFPTTRRYTSLAATMGSGTTTRSTSLTPAPCAGPSSSPPAAPRRVSKGLPVPPLKACLSVALYSLTRIIVTRQGATGTRPPWRTAGSL